MFDQSVILRFADRFLDGFLTTAWICAVSLAAGIALGLAVFLVRRIPLAPARWFYEGYVGLLRGTPFLIQVFILYYGGPGFGIRLSATTTALVGLSVYGSAYFAEIFRAGFEAVPRGQVEAARMLGIDRGQILRHIELPQMAALILPPSVNQCIILIKESAVLSVITVPELTTVTTRVVSETFEFAGPYLLLALLYWLLVEATARGGRRLERATGRHLPNHKG
ncbi:amino acid ABC transporter permease [Azospirillum sp. ST 5-10]|uniref:amino acid ABC transporter permease n=1 Tax=unclassified Azospirillum TaxID=2630922 RepID=UPI003F49EC17